MGEILLQNIKERCDGEKGRPKSLRELERLAEMSENSIYKWKTSTPAFSRILTVANLLDTTIEDLTKGDSQHE